VREPASVWFDSEAEFRLLCSDAQSLACSESAMDFTRDMMLGASAQGLNFELSEKQLKWLCQIADWDLPSRRS
jgi:hypothetical protein